MVMGRSCLRPLLFAHALYWGSWACLGYYARPHGYAAAR